MSDDHILFAVEDGIATLTLNRPEARNALTFEMYQRIADLCASVVDMDARAMILTGAGEKAFASGTDIAKFRDFRSAEDALNYETEMDRVFTAIETCPIPTIAALSGACTGGGGAIAACCDVRIASADLKFGFPIARTLGNCLAGSTLTRLNALMGQGRVTEMLFTSRLLGAEEARSAGFISEIASDHAALIDRAKELATQIAGHAPLTLRATKEAQRRLRRGSGETDDLITLCYTSEDFKEGLEAFLAKRKPDWKGS